VKVLDYLQKKLAECKVHMTLLDPDRLHPEDTASLAHNAEKAGTDALMVGGSTGVTREKVDETLKAIKAKTTLPVILFPSSGEGVSRYADALYFMSLLNSRDVRMIVGEQRKVSHMIKQWGLETISMAYLLVEPGMRAGVVGKAELIPRSKPDIAVQYALTAQYFGMDFVYLEAGSGAPQHVPLRMITVVKNEISIPLIVGGGIKTPEAAHEISVAGADIVVTGTIVEQATDLSQLRSIVKAVKRL